MALKDSRSQNSVPASTARPRGWPNNWRGASVCMDPSVAGVSEPRPAAAWRGSAPGPLQPGLAPEHRGSARAVLHAEALALHALQGDGVVQLQHLAGLLVDHPLDAALDLAAAPQVQGHLRLEPEAAVVAAGVQRLADR